MKTIILTSTLLLLSTTMTTALAVCPAIGQVMGVATTQGNTTVRFKGLTSPGQTVTVSGLTLTALKKLDASQIATAFSSQQNGVQPTLISNLDYTFGTTTLSGWKAALAAGINLTFNPASPNTTPLEVSSNTAGLAPSITTVATPLNNGVALNILLSGNTVCVGSTGNWQAQEYHKTPSGATDNLIDFHHGNTSTTDPIAPVGSWSINSINNTVSYTYHGGSSYTNTVYDNGNGSYTFCDTNGNTTIVSAIKAGQVGC
ncbi:MAG: hypothetical protein D0531_01595 [Methylococcales bacterium]|nr:MAG: hypothetical protein D0531_01595 [Methylococcales bacterium]